MHEIALTVEGITVRGIIDPERYDSLLGELLELTGMKANVTTERLTIDLNNVNATIAIQTHRHV